MNSILIIDDDIELTDLVSEFLTEEGFTVTAINNSVNALVEAISGNYALVILDVMLPEINGFELLRRIRASSQIPVIMLTARGNDIDKIVGLEIGADDYVPKPFNPRELVARIRAILRRIKPDIEITTSPAKPKVDRLSFDDLQVNPNTRTVLQSGKSLELTTVEFDLLLVLLRAEGGVVTREELVVQALGRRFLPYDRSIDTHMSNLRKKLGKRPDNSERIKAIRNIGYRYVVGE